MNPMQTHVLEDGQWVSRTISAHEFLAEKGASRSSKRPEPGSKPPRCGLFTTTVIESPEVRQVLPVQLRSSQHNDVALVGDTSVQICELSPDRQLCFVATKNDFDTRISSAVVMGPPHIPCDRLIKPEDGDTHMSNLLQPQQLLVIVLDTGLLVFLYMKQSASNEWEFAWTCNDVPCHRFAKPGFHIAIDPLSRYLTVACCQDLFVVFRLQSMETLCQQFSEGRHLEPVISRRGRSVRGIIHKIEYLYSAQETQVVMIIIVIQPEASRLAVYEWDENENESLEAIFSKEVHGHRLDDNYRMPLIIIPLTVSSAFIMVTQYTTAICSDVLVGPPTFVPFQLESCQDTEYHHGSGKPLWTAWTRPRRFPSYLNKLDVIYLAREDGLVNFFEFGNETGIERCVSMSVDCNIDTAFACLYDQFGDILVAGGDSGSVGMFNIKAKQAPQRIASIPNWTPSVDAAVVRDVIEGPSQNFENSTDTSASSIETGAPFRPPQIFTCSGRGITGALTELRYGLEAKVGLDLTYSSPINRCWVLSSCITYSPKAGIISADDTMSDGFLILLGLPDSSAVLHVSEDFSDVSEKFYSSSQSSVQFDLNSTTLAAHETSSGVVVQITAARITIASPTECHQHRIGEIVREPSTALSHAAVDDDTVALSTYSGSTNKVTILSLTGSSISLVRSIEVPGDVTCISTGTIEGKRAVLVGLWNGRDPVLAVHFVETVQQHPTPPIMLDIQRGMIRGLVGEGGGTNVESLGALTSILLFGEDPGIYSIIVGTRHGDVVTARLDLHEPGKVQFHHDKFSLSPCHVFPGVTFGTSKSILVCSDAELSIMTNFKTDRSGSYFEERRQVWPTDAADSAMRSPAINSVARMCPMSDMQDSTLAMVAGPRILIAEMQVRPGVVPRHLPVHGTPVKMLYAPWLGAFVTVLMKNGYPSLHFIDSLSGEDLSSPLKKIDNHADRYVNVDYISGLGVHGRKVIDMAPWRYRNGGNVWGMIVLSIRTGGGEGRVVIVSAERDDGPDMPGRIRFWTIIKRPYKSAPLYALTSDHHGLFLCQGENVEYLTIDGEKTLKLLKQHKLSSPAIWMQVVDGRLQVLTTQHSLMILDYTSQRETGSSKMMSSLHTVSRGHFGMHAIALRLSGEERQHSITIISDPSCLVTGLWGPSDKDKQLMPVFSAGLPSSVRKFFRGGTRRLWASRSPHWRGKLGEPDDSESDVLGLGIEGSLQHFSLLGEGAWRLLRYVQNLATTSRLICPFATSEIRASGLNLEPRVDFQNNMHVNGDILQRCLDRRALEQLFSEPEHFDKLVLHVKAFVKDGDGPAPAAMDDKGAWFELVYDIIKWHLRPVL